MENFKLHWFGDSFIWGQELTEPLKNRFSKVISDELGIEEINWSMPGTGNQSSFNIIPKLVETSKVDMIVLSLTSPWRDAIPPQEISYEAKKFNLEEHTETRRTDSDVFGISLALQQLVLLDYYLESKNIPRIYMDSFVGFNLLNDNITPDYLMGVDPCQTLNTTLVQYDEKDIEYLKKLWSVISPNFYKPLGFNTLWDVGKNNNDIRGGGHIGNKTTELISNELKSKVIDIYNRQ